MCCVLSVVSTPGISVTHSIDTLPTIFVVLFLLGNKREAVNEKVSGGLLDMGNTYFYGPRGGIRVTRAEVLIGRRSRVRVWSCIIFRIVSVRMH